MKYEYIIILITSIICVMLLIFGLWIYHLGKEYEKSVDNEYVDCINQNNKDPCIYERCKALHNADGRINYQNMLELQYQNCLLNKK